MNDNEEHCELRLLVIHRGGVRACLGFRETLAGFIFVGCYGNIITMRLLDEEERTMLLFTKTRLLAVACAVSMLYPILGTKKAFQSLLAGLAKNTPSDLVSSLYQFYFVFVFFFLLPLCLMKKQERQNLGFTLGNIKLGTLSTVAFVALCIPLVWFGSKDPDMLAEYPLSKKFTDSFSLTLIYVFSLFLFYVGWEAVFRGVLLFSLVTSLGNLSAIMIQTAISCILHIGKPTAEYVASIPFGIFMGILAIRTHSFLYPVLTHFLIGLMNDMICAQRQHLF